jgi:hypothetical protein
MLTAIKLLHTLIWAFLAASILVLPVVGIMRRFRWAAILTGLVLLECGVLALNGGRCPLSDLAARFTNDRANNFDIYLPNWLAQHNQVVFGTLFVAGELVVLGCWSRQMFATSTRQANTSSQKVARRSQRTDSPSKNRH